MACYNGKRIELTSLGLNGIVAGVLFSGLGKAIASLYKPTPNAFGYELFDNWVKDLLPAQFSVKLL